jgi:diketogulonate reductase-like aldo/keto reductase
MHSNKVELFLDVSIKNLQTEYVDLYLIHWPVGLIFVDENGLMPRDKDGELLLDMSTDLEAIWKCMELQVKARKAKAIGLSNFNEIQIQRILNCCEIPPAVLQVGSCIKWSMS